MNPAKVSKRTRKDSTVWRRLLSEKEQSPLSVRAFCQDKGITEASYYSWRKRLGDIREKDGSAANCGHNPFEYLRDVLQRLPDQPLSHLDELLPPNWVPAKGIDA